MSDVLVSSPIICGEGGIGASGAGGEGFGVDPNLDPELAEVRKSKRFDVHKTKTKTKSLTTATQGSPPFFGGG